MRPLHSICAALTLFSTAVAVYMLSEPPVAVGQEFRTNSGLRESGLRESGLRDRTGDPSAQNLPSENGFKRFIQADVVEVKHIDKVDVPAETEGVLMDIDFEEGDTVDVDRILARVDDRAAVLTKKLKEAEELQARIKAADTVNLRDAQNNKALADTEAGQFRELAKEGAVPFFEMKRKELEATKQGLRIELAEMETKVSKVDALMKQTELKMADEQLDRCVIKAPVHGFIEERLVNRGQWVQPGTPIATVIRMDRLRVEGLIDGMDYPSAVVKGAVAQVRIFNSNEADTVVDGQLGYVSMELNVNGNRRVWVEVENSKVGDDWLLKPGMKAEIIVPIQ